MNSVEAPLGMAAIIGLVLIAVVVAVLAPNYIKEVVGSVVTALGMLGLKLAETNSKNGSG